MIIKIFAGLLLGLSLSVSHAASPLAWEQLTNNEQHVLKSYSHNWEKMNPEQQRRLQKVARYWQKMNAQQRSEMQQRSARWKEMPEEKKQKIRKNFRQFEQFPPEQQQKIKQRVQSFLKLPKKERLKLRQQWQQMNQEQRNVKNKQLRKKGDKEVIPVKEVSKNDKTDEKVKHDEATEESNNSRLDSNRMQNNRTKPQRLNRPMRRTH